MTAKIMAMPMKRTIMGNIKAGIRIQIIHTLQEQTEKMERVEKAMT